MPMIEFTTTEKVGESTAKAIKRALGGNISIFPGKPEARAMVVIHDQTPIFFGGEPGPAALVSVALVGEQPAATYDEYARTVIQQIIQILPNLTKERFYVKYQTLEHKAWGKDVL